MSKIDRCAASEMRRARAVPECPERRPVETGAPGVAECRLLGRVLGVAVGGLCRVRLDLCAACCASFPPSDADWNPPIASRLYDLTGRLLEQDDGSRSRRQELEQLHARAEECLALGGHVAIERRPLRSRSGAAPRVGLIGEDTQRGLGNLCRAFAHRFPAQCWLTREPNADEARVFLDGLDWLFFFERPAWPEVVALARTTGVRVACVPMWEWLDEQAAWLPWVDLMIAPTRACHERLVRCRARLGLAWEIVDLPWPIDVDAFRFRERTVCRRFLFVNGAGGVRELDRDRARWDGRKNAAVVAEAARRAPELSFLVLSQTADLPAFPENVTVRVGSRPAPADLYDEGDVCLQPSRWEGLGLPLLECQASGLPLITTDAAPMNEHNPWRVLPTTTTRARLAEHRTIPVHEVDPGEVVRTLREVRGAPLSHASQAARRFVEEHHSWTIARPRLRAPLTKNDDPIGNAGPGR